MMRKCLLLFFISCLTLAVNAQYLKYEVQDKDTVNIVDLNNMKQGVWREFWPNGDLDVYKRQDINIADTVLLDKERLIVTTRTNIS